MNMPLSNPKDGENCYHLVVSNSNDWINAHPSIKANPFNSDSYRSCFCSSNKADVEKVAKQIRELFSNITDDILAVDPSKPFYRIHLNTAADVITINVCESPGMELPDQQRNYKNNYFADRGKAEKTRDEIIKIILKFK